MVMVDELKVWPHARPPFHRGSCHITTDGPLEELHALAARVGLRRRWFQEHPTAPHYDLTPPRREAAIAAGAVFVSAREQALARLRRRRRPMPDVLGTEACGLGEELRAEQALKDPRRIG